MDHSEFFKTLKNGELSQVYLFTGDEAYVMQSALSQLEDAVVGDDLREVNLTVLSGNPTGEQICDACETVPFMAEKRMVIVTESGFVGNEGRFDGEERMTDYLKAPAEFTVLVFVCPQADKRKKGYKLLAEKTVVEFKKLSDGELAKWIEKKLRSAGLSIANETLYFLCEYADERPEALVNELEKLISYKVSGEITKEDIISIVTPSNEYNMFKMTDAIVAKNLKTALMFLSGMLTQREEPIYILGAISKQYRQLLSVKVMLEEKKSKQEIISALGLRDFVFTRLSAIAQKTTEEKLKTAVDLCYQTDEGLKTGKAFNTAALHALTVRLCSI